MIVMARPCRRWLRWEFVVVAALLAMLGGLIYAATGGVSLGGATGPKPLATSPIAPAGVKVPAYGVPMSLTLDSHRKVVVAGELTTEYLVQTSFHVIIATNGIPASEASYRVTLFPNATYWAACTVTVNRLTYYGLPNTTPSTVTTMWYVPVYSFTFNLAGLPDCALNGK